MVAMPFPHYEGSAGGTKAAGAEALAQQKAFEGVSDDVEKRTITAGGQVEGLLQAPVKASAQGVVDKAHDLGAASALAAGALKTFGGAISTYNTKVDQLNKRYETAKGGGFGVAAGAGAKPGMTDDEKSSAHADAVGAADQALRQELEKERKAAEKELEDEGDAQAAALSKGPSDSAILVYALSGALPAQAVLPYTGATLAQINTVRGQVQSVKSVGNLRRNLPTLAKYLLKIRSQDLKDHVDVTNAWAIRKMLQNNAADNLALSQRLDRYKQVKLDNARYAKLVFGDKIVTAATPGGFFKNDGMFERFLKTGGDPARIKDMSPAAIRQYSMANRVLLGGADDLSKLGKANTVLGRALAPIGLASSAYDLYKLPGDWDKLSTEKKVTRTVGSTAGLVSGGLGTAAMVAGAAGLAFPPAGAAIAVGAGVVALGAFAYENREAIADAGKAVVDGVSDFVDDPGGALKDAGGAIKDGIGSLF